MSRGRERRRSDVGIAPYGRDGNFRAVNDRPYGDGREQRI